MTIQLDESPWRPIESAPKDGTYILVCDKYDRHVARWTKSYCCAKEPDAWCIGYTLDEYNSLQTVEPTHWMPLQDFPESIKLEWAKSMRSVGISDAT